MLVNSKIILEAKACLKLAIPIAASQLVEIANNFVDTVMMGSLGWQVLAAGGLASTTCIAIIWTSTGMVSAVGALAAIAVGSDRSDRVCRIACQGLWLILTLSAPIMLLLWNFGPILLKLGQQESNVILAQSYLRAIVWGFPALIGFIVLKNLASALNRPQIILAIACGGLFLNAAANYILAFGKFGLPALGLAGLGWATTLTFWVNFIAGIIYISWDKEFRNYELFREWYRLDVPLFKEILKFGLPTACLFAIEIGLNTVTTYLMGYLGTVPLAAHQIVSQSVTIAFMVPLGISYATTVRVGQNLGENDPEIVRQAGFVGIAIGSAFASIVALIFCVFPDAIISLYLDTNNPDNAPITELAIALLSIAALYHIFDGMQVIAGGALRGLKDTRVPLLIGIFSYGVVGLGTEYFMGIYWHGGSMGLWLGLVLALFTAGVLLSGRFYEKTAQMYEVNVKEKS